MTGRLTVFDHWVGCLHKHSKNHCMEEDTRYKSECQVSRSKQVANAVLKNWQTVWHHPLMFLGGILKTAKEQQVSGTSIARFRLMSHRLGTLACLVPNPYPPI